MTKRELIEFFIGLSYSTGYEQARKDLELEAALKKQRERAYLNGRIAEAEHLGNRKRALDLQGGAE